MKKMKIIFFLITMFSFGISFSQNYGYVNEQNVFVIQPNFIEAREFKEGFAAVRYKNKNGWIRWQFINEKGDFAFKGRYWSVNDFNNGFTTVEYGIGSWGIINTSEKIIVSLTADFMSAVNEGMVLYQKNDKVGFFNTDGVKVVKPIYERAEVFSNGLALVKLNGLYGFINKLGEIVIPIKYSNATSFVNFKAKTFVANEYYELDTSGKETRISKEKFDENDLSKLKIVENNSKYLKVCEESKGNKSVNSFNATNSTTSTTSGNISSSSYALDIFNNLGCMAIYVGDTMYVVLVKGKNLGNVDIVSARAAAKVGVTNFKYQWFSGNNCEGLKSQYGSVFNVKCGYELSLD